MKNLHLTLLLSALIPTLSAQEATAPEGESPAPAPVVEPAVEEEPAVVDTTAPETPAAEEEPDVVDTTAPETPAAEEEPAVVDTTAPETPAEEPAVEPDLPNPVAPDDPFTGADGMVSDLTTTPDDTATPPIPTEEPPAPVLGSEQEKVLADGVSHLGDILKAITTVRNTKTANEAAALIQSELDGIRAWRQEFDTALHAPGMEDFYQKLYLPQMERRCMAVAELAVYMAEARYFFSDDLRRAFLRAAQELPQTYRLTPNVQWSCSGVILLSMLDEAVSRVTDPATAKAASYHMQEVVDALQPWREAAQGLKGTPKPAQAQAGETKTNAVPKRSYLKSYPSIREGESFAIKNLVEQYYLSIRTHAKRLQYAGCYYADALHPTVAQAADTVVDICALPEAEHHICQGIVLLGALENILAGVKDTESARAAVAPLMQLTSELQQWGQGFATLPEPDDDTTRRCEKAYMPKIDQINIRLKSQAERISSANYYGSKELFETLKNLIRNFQ